MKKAWKRLMEQAAARNRTIRFLRETGLSHQEIARRHGISRQRVGQILENGK